MGKNLEIYAVVEGSTEKIFIQKLLAPYLANQMIYIYAMEMSKPGQKGGDVKFERVKNDLGMYLKQRGDTYVTTFFDYYGVKEWPGLDKIPAEATPEIIACTLNKATKEEVNRLFSEHGSEKRFIPYVSVHEFEALLFCNTKILSDSLSVSEADINKAISKFESPEAINNSRETAPSKRLDKWSARKKFPKKTAGITIAEKIGIPLMREKCPLFNAWIKSFEEIKK